MNKKLITTLVLSSLVASAFAVSAGAAPVGKSVAKDNNGKVHDVMGKLGKVSGATAEARALAALDKVGADFGFAKAEGNFKAKNSHVDENGVTHTKMNQVINGIPVVGHEMIVHEANGDVQGVTGDFANVTPNTTTASISSTDAIAKATASTGFTGKLSRPATAELSYAAQDNGSAKLVYNVNVAYDGTAPGNWTILVDAQNGSIVSSLNSIDFDNTATASARGVLGDTKTINTYYYTSYGSYYMEDHTKSGLTSHGTDIETYDWRNGSYTYYDIGSTTNTWNNPAAVDAHYYAGKVYDYYLGLGRTSWNGAGAQIISTVHYSTGYNNAYWDGGKMVYGDGDGVEFRSLSGGYDVDAHELTHAVTQTTSNLTYSNQSGALNESWSDAQATVMDGNDWMIGEDVYTPGTSGDALRYMDNPSLGGQPGTMSGYVNTSSDNGGVHTNSGIPNHAFYLFATNIGSRTIAGKVWYVASRDYMTSSTNFSGAKTATLNAVAALYGSGSSYYSALQSAWSSVGI